MVRNSYSVCHVKHVFADRGLDWLHPVELCRDEQVVGSNAASGSQPWEGKEGKREDGTEDSGGNKLGQVVSTG